LVQINRYHCTDREANPAHSQSSQKQTSNPIPGHLKIHSYMEVLVLKTVFCVQKTNKWLSWDFQRLLSFGYIFPQTWIDYSSFRIFF